MPIYVSMTVTLPENIQMDQRTTMMLNGKHVYPAIYEDTNTLVLNGLPQSDMTSFNLEFPSGLKNPTEGPYSYKFP